MFFSYDTQTHPCPGRYNKYPIADDVMAHGDLHN